MGKKNFNMFDDKFHAINGTRKKEISSRLINRSARSRLWNVTIKKLYETITKWSLKFRDEKNLVVYFYFVVIWNATRFIQFATTTNNDNFPTWYRRIPRKKQTEKERKNNRRNDCYTRVASWWDTIIIIAPTSSRKIIQRFSFLPSFLLPRLLTL